MRATLNQLKPGQIGSVVRIGATDAPDAGLIAKLREIGFSEGDEVEFITAGPFGGQPLAVRLNRTLIALRRAEAEAIEVAPRAASETVAEGLAEAPAAALAGHD